MPATPTSASPSTASPSTASPLGAFLRARRAQLSPDDLGVPSYGTRRVPGLRREELALLAGVSPTYYTRLEQGQSQNASDAVLDALAHALRLGPDEHRHLRALARPPAGAAAVRRAVPLSAPVRLLVAGAGTPVVALDVDNDVLAWNAAGHRLVAGHLPADAPEHPERRPNLLRMLFLDPHTRELHPEWASETLRAVAALRVVAARYPDDPGLAALVGELTIKSPEFAALWARHPVGTCDHGVKRFRHPTLGEFALDFTVLSPPDSSGHRLLVHSAEPGTPAAAALALLDH